MWKNRLGGETEMSGTATTPRRPAIAEEIVAFLKENGWKGNYSIFSKGDNEIELRPDRMDYNYLGGSLMGSCSYDCISIGEEGLHIASAMNDLSGV